jgi:hypothetical protein
LIVTDATRHLRGPLIAIVALAMSAGIAFAAHPTAGDRLASHSNLTAGSEATDGPDETEVDETNDPNESADPNEAADANSAAGTNDNCTTDPTNMTDQELAALGHGSYVCWAAHQPTPDGYANHGAWVSHWAHMGKGHDASSNGTTHGNAGKAKGLKHGQ